MAQSVDPGVRAATAAELDRLRDALAVAFQDDPVFGWLLPDDAKRPARLRRFFAQELRHVLKRGRISTSDALAGAALALPPGRWRTPPLATLLQGPPFGLRLPLAALITLILLERATRVEHAAEELLLPLDRRRIDTPRVEGFRDALRLAREIFGLAGRVA